MKEKSYAYYSDVGGRKNNEDSFLVKKIKGSYLFIVADGLGGHEDGEQASAIAVATVKNVLMYDVSDNLEGAVQAANEAVLKAQKEKNSQMKTTLTAALVGEEETIVANVGDSRTYALKDGKIVFQTVDHSASQLAVSVGEIKKEEIRNHPDRNVLVRALGAKEDVKVDLYTLKNEEYDALLLCSDGFWEYVYEDEMESFMRDSGDVRKWLYLMRNKQLERAPENTDNNTAIAVF